MTTNGEIDWGWNDEAEDGAGRGKGDRTGYSYRSCSDDLCADRAAERDEVNIRFTVFTGHSVLPDGVEDNGGMNHIHTWPAVYRMDEIRRWLLSQ